MPISRSNKKTIVITIGDPAGIGPEVTLKALASPAVRGLADFFVIGDRRLLKRQARQLRLPAPRLLVDRANVPAALRLGKVDPACGRAAIDYLDTAVGLLRDGAADALVTAPINKESIVRAGFSGFQGHTEYLAGETGTKKGVVMMFVGERLKVTLVTRHIPFARVPAAVTAAKIEETVRVTHHHLRTLFGVKRPRIAVAGLNPHAGEHGLFGAEDQRIVAPVVKRLNRLLGGISGPLPADVVFQDALAGTFDAVVALYHDQGLIPFKLLYFKDGVNMTLGLPFIRTSPDHGTAFDIAGKGVADPSSMIEAIRLACRLARRPAGRPR